MIEVVCYTHEVLPLEQELLNFVSNTYAVMQWPGVIVLMAIESACIPVPSELIIVRISSCPNIFSSRALSTLRILPFNGKIA